MDNERRGIPVKKVKAEVPIPERVAYMKTQEEELRKVIGEIPADIEGVDVMDGVNIEMSDGSDGEKKEDDETFTPTARDNSNETGMSAGA